MPHSALGTRGLQSTPPKPLHPRGPHGRAGGGKEDEGGETRQLGFYVRAQDGYVAELSRMLGTVRKGWSLL